MVTMTMTLHELPIPGKMFVAWWLENEKSLNANEYKDAICDIEITLYIYVNTVATLILSKYFSIEKQT